MGYSYLWMNFDSGFRMHSFCFTEVASKAVIFELSFIDFQYIDFIINFIDKIYYFLDCSGLTIQEHRPQNLIDLHFMMIVSQQHLAPAWSLDYRRTRDPLPFHLNFNLHIPRTFSVHNFHFGLLLHPNYCIRFHFDFRLAHPTRRLDLPDHCFLIFGVISAMITLYPFDCHLLLHDFLKNLGNHPQLNYFPFCLR